MAYRHLVGVCCVLNTKYMVSDLCIPTPTTDSNTSTGMIWVTLNMASAAEACCEPSGNFTLSWESSPCLYLLVSWVWLDWPLTWLTNHCLSVLWRCWLAHLTCNIISEMTYNVLISPTIPTYKYPLDTKRTPNSGSENTRNRSWNRGAWSPMSYQTDPELMHNLIVHCWQYTPCPYKKGATDFFAVTFTNIDGFS